MPKHELIHGDCLEVLPTLGFFDCLIGDPPDAIGLKYNSFDDNMTESEYRGFLWKCLNLGNCSFVASKSIKYCET